MQQVSWVKKLLEHMQCFYLQASFAAGGLEASSRIAQLDESTDRSAAEQGADNDSDSAAVVPKRVRPDLVEEIVQKTRWDGSMTQAIKKINRRPLWTYTP